MSLMRAWLFILVSEQQTKTLCIFYWAHEGFPHQLRESIKPITLLLEHILWPDDTHHEDLWVALTAHIMIVTNAMIHMLIITFLSNCKWTDSDINESCYNVLRTVWLTAAAVCGQAVSDGVCVCVCVGVVFCVVVALAMGSPVPQNTRQGSCTSAARSLLSNLSHIMEKVR